MGVGVGVGVGVATGGVGVAEGEGSGSATSMLTVIRTITAAITAMIRINPKIICQRVAFSELACAAVPGRDADVVEGALLLAEYLR